MSKLPEKVDFSGNQNLETRKSFFDLSGKSRLLWGLESTIQKIIFRLTTMGNKAAKKAANKAKYGSTKRNSRTDCCASQLLRLAPNPEYPIGTYACRRCQTIFETAWIENALCIIFKTHLKAVENGQATSWLFKDFLKFEFNADD